MNRKEEKAIVNELEKLTKRFEKRVKMARQGGGGEDVIVLALKDIVEQVYRYYSNVLASLRLHERKKISLILRCWKCALRILSGRTRVDANTRVLLLRLTMLLIDRPEFINLLILSVDCSDATERPSSPTPAPAKLVGDVIDQSRHNGSNDKSGAAATVGGGDDDDDGRKVERKLSAGDSLADASSLPKSRLVLPDSLDVESIFFVLLFKTMSYAVKELDELHECVLSDGGGTDDDSLQSYNTATASVSLATQQNQDTMFIDFSVHIFTVASFYLADRILPLLEAASLQVCERLNLSDKSARAVREWLDRLASENRARDMASISKSAAKNGYLRSIQHVYDALPRSMRKYERELLESNTNWLRYLFNREVYYYLYVEKLMRRLSVHARTSTAATPSSPKGDGMRACLVEWHLVPGYDLAVTPFLRKMCDLSPRDYTHNVCQVTQVLLANRSLLTMMTNTLLSNTNVWDSVATLRALQTLSSWFAVIKSSGDKLPFNFDHEFFTRAVVILLDCEHFLVNIEVLAFLYTFFDLFPSDRQLHFAQQLLLADTYFNKFFLHWDNIVRNIFHFLMLYRCFPIVERGIEQRTMSMINLLAKATRRERRQQRLQPSGATSPRHSPSSPPSSSSSSAPTLISSSSNIARNASSPVYAQISLSAFRVAKEDHAEWLANPRTDDHGRLVYPKVQTRPSRSADESFETSTPSGPVPIVPPTPNARTTVTVTRRLTKAASSSSACSSSSSRQKVSGTLSVISRAQGPSLDPRIQTAQVDRSRNKRTSTVITEEVMPSPPSTRQRASTHGQHEGGVLGTKHQSLDSSTYLRDRHGVNKPLRPQFNDDLAIQSKRSSRKFTKFFRKKETK
jgi:Protein of unknown function (DUF1765)